MALEAFYKLKEKKKKNILESISTCLKNKNYDELSVNDISVAADISRGSFYNYFNDKSDAVETLIESRISEYLDLYREAIKISGYDLIEGTRKIYGDIEELFRDEINVLKMKNLKFFIEFIIQSVHSKRFEKEIDEIVGWLIKNTKEGHNKLNTYKNMANVLDMLIVLVLNTIFNNIVIKSEYFSKYDDFNYKLDLIKNSFK
ncbi:MAG: TetR/AcrR family transcriptional regulator [Lachnospiraceae bacterium]|nr:TetR/AcrR family transcriptional regulator [Lachnospiraceae bacterium]